MTPEIRTPTTKKLQELCTMHSNNLQRPESSHDESYEHRFPTSSLKTNRVKSTKGQVLEFCSQAKQARCGRSLALPIFFTAPLF